MNIDLDEVLWSEIVNHINFNDNMTFLEFGVASGNTMVAMLNNLVKINKIPKLVVGFDSFEGLPQEEPGTIRPIEWYKGAFNLQDEMKNNFKITDKPNNFQEAIQKLETRFKDYDFPIKFIKGFYDSSLTNNIVEQFQIQPACFVHIDCDMYISTKQALDFLARNDLFAKDCLIRYDDWVINGIPEFSAGESKAHLEICTQYWLNLELIENNGNATLFRYKGKY